MTSDELLYACDRIKSTYLANKQVLPDKAAYEIYIADMKLAIDAFNDVLPPEAPPTTSRPRPCPEAAALDKIVHMCEAYLDEVDEGSNNDDSEHYLFEDLMNIIYGGQKIWTWINSKL